MLTGLTACVAVLTASFLTFNIAALFSGFYASVHQSYRFAAADTATDRFRPKAISWVMIGGMGRQIFSPSPGEGINLLMEFTEEPTRERLVAWLNSIGMTGIVLKYRVPRRPGQPVPLPPPGPLLDAQRALSQVRSKAGEWGIDPNRLPAGSDIRFRAPTVWDQYRR